jgi:hypothetical protein
MALRFPKFSRAVMAVTLSLICAGTVQANEPTCFNNAGDNYCQYFGRVRMLYVNAEGRIILYFDTPMAANAPSDVGLMGITIFDSAVFNIADDPDVAKTLYSTLLSAQSRRAPVTVQMRDSLNGRIRISRVWLHE